MDEAIVIGSIVIYHATDTERPGNNNQEVAPAIVTAVWPDEYLDDGNPIGLNLKVQADGDGILWKTSVKFGTDPGQWSYKE